jgi:hypothetical protein
MESNTNSVVESKLIVLNAKDGDKLNGEYLSHVRFNFKDILKKEEDIFYVGLSLLSAEIPCSFYNINVNDATLNYSVNSVEYSMTLTEGNYTATTFIAEFVSQFSTGGHGHTVSMSFNKTTGKLTTTKTAGVYDIVYLSGSIYEVLGMLEGAEYTIATSLIHPYMLNLLGVKKLKVYSPSFSLENYDSTGHTSGTLVHTISVDVPSYSLINYQNTSGSVSRVRNKTVNDIEIIIRDENHGLIDFNNVYWDMTFVLKIYRRMQPPTNDNLNLTQLAMSIINKDGLENNPLPTKKEIREVLDKMDEDNLRQLELLLS